jgi:hypothetical protein
MIASSTTAEALATELVIRMHQRAPEPSAHRPMTASNGQQADGPTRMIETAQAGR